MFVGTVHHRRYASGLTIQAVHVRVTESLMCLSLLCVLSLPFLRVGLSDFRKHLNDSVAEQERYPVERVFVAVWYLFHTVMLLQRNIHRVV